MSKKLKIGVVLVGLCALSLLLLSCGSSSSRPSGLLYVLTQGTSGSGNNVSSFSIDLNSGNLSLINSNATVCCGLPVSIVLDPTGATAFVLSQGGISAYPVNSDGSLGTQTNPWTVPAGDTAKAMTRDAAGNFLFVITQAPALYVFATTPGSTSLTLTGNDCPGTSTPCALPLTRIPSALSAITLSTPAEEVLYVTSTQDLATTHNDNTLSVYVVGSDGTLTEKIGSPGSPYTTRTIDPLSVLAVNTNPAGEATGGVFVYVGAAGNASGAIDVFQMCIVVNANCVQADVDDALLNAVGTPTSAGQKPVAMVVDPTNTFLYVVSEGTNQLFGFRIAPAAGTLTPLSTPNLPTGSQPVALAMHSTGKFLYTSNSAASNISGFTLSTTSGAMSTPITVTSPAGPSGMTAR
jgi:hypothetical protein